MARSPSGFVLGFTGCILAVAAPGVDESGDRALQLSGAALLIGIGVVTVLRPRLVLDADGLCTTGVFSSRKVAWDRIVAISWLEDNSPNTGPGMLPVLLGADGRSQYGGKIPEHRRFDVNSWLREHQPEIRIDPKPPWRDRFGAWHVAEPGYEPVETMMSVRRSLVGPWEIVARSCDGGFRAEQRVVRSGVVVTREPVRETLADAKADGVRLVREAVEAAASAHE